MGDPPRLEVCDNRLGGFSEARYDSVAFFVAFTEFSTGSRFSRSDEATSSTIFVADPPAPELRMISANEAIDLVEDRACLVDGTTVLVLPRPSGTVEPQARHDRVQRPGGLPARRGTVCIYDPLPGCAHDAEAFATTPVPRQWARTPSVPTSRQARASPRYAT